MHCLKKGHVAVMFSKEEASLSGSIGLLVLPTEAASALTWRTRRLGLGQQLWAFRPSVAGELHRRPQLRVAKACKPLQNGLCVHCLPSSIITFRNGGKSLPSWAEILRKIGCGIRKVEPAPDLLLRPCTSELAATCKCCNRASAG